MPHRWVVAPLMALLLIATSTRACDCCKPSGLMIFDSKSLASGIGKSKEEKPVEYKWSSDSSMEYRSWRQMSAQKAFEINDRPHGHMHGVVDEIFVAERIGYSVNADLDLGLTQTYRHLRQKNVEDPLLLGQHEFENGIGDLSFDFKYRFMRQGKNGFPVDLTLFGDLKAPTGDTHERTPSGEFFDAENQPGSGSWDGSLGVSAAKQWGRWHAYGAVSGAIKGEGEQHFKAGDIIRTALGASTKLKAEPLGWKLFPSLGGQYVHEFKGTEDGEIDRNHGGETIYVTPGISAKPLDRLIMTLSTPIPVYQEYNGTHQKQAYSVQFNFGVRF